MRKVNRSTIVSKLLTYRQASDDPEWFSGLYSKSAVKSINPGVANLTNSLL